MSEFEYLYNEAPNPEEKALLDSELEEYQRNPGAGSTWEEVVVRIRKPHCP